MSDASTRQTPDALEEAVTQLLHRPIERVVEARRQVVDYDPFLAGRSIHRLRGTAAADGSDVEWSFIEKCTGARDDVSPYLWDNGRREVDAYRSGLLADLPPGMAAPACLRADEDADGRLTLWIEDLAGSARRLRTAPDVLLAARHLGRLAGHWVGRVPPAAWLFRGWIDRHRQPEAMAGGMATLDRLAGDAEAESRLGRRAEECRWLVALQDRLPAALDALPQTLCHHDAVAANVFQRGPGGTAETVLIDWESVGPGPAGADLASLLFASARRGDLSSAIVSTVLPAAVEAYAEGIAEEGGALPVDVLRLGVFGSMALRWTLVRDVVQVLLGESTARRGSAPHESAEAALEDLLALVPVLFEAAEEAAGLVSRDVPSR
jgi:hypothetical protein